MRYTATLSTAHNYLRIFNFYGEFYAQVIRPFCRHHLFKYGKVPIPGSRKQAWKVTHVFAKSNYDQTEYRLPVNLLKDFLDFAQSKGYNTSRFKMEEESEITGFPCTFKFQPGFENPREDQVEWIDYQLDPGPTKVNNAATGQGKTYMALYTMVKLGVRAIITVQPRYITTWLNDIAKTLQLEEDDVLLWENTSLPELGELIRSGKLNPKIVILPTTRISTYLRNTKEDAHKPSLDEIFRNINAGYRIIDEGHESFHEVCLSIFYGNFRKLLVLSATLKADDPFMDRMYKTMFPKSMRLKESEPENYIDVVAYMYQLCQRKHRVNTQQFGSYNDLAFEASILKSKLLTDFYFQIADKFFSTYYLPLREPGTKFLFFFSLIKMAQKMKDMFKEKYPELDIETYLGTLDKKNPTKYLEHEIVITTPGSCGTGKDIPGLIGVFCPHTVFSDQRNKQIIGRLRQLRGKFNDRITPFFGFPVCADIPKQVECLQKRKQSFANKQKTFKLIDSNCSLT